MSGPASATTSATIENVRFEVVPRLPYSLDLASADFWFVQPSRNISNDISHVMKFNLVQVNVFENTLKVCTVMGLINLLSTGSVELNERETVWQNEIQKQSTHSELYFMFHFRTLSASYSTNMEALLFEHPSYNLDIPL